MPTPATFSGVNAVSRSIDPAARTDADKGRLREIHFNLAKSVDEFQALRAHGPAGEEIYQLFQTVR